MSDTATTRSHEHEIAIQAPIEAVWKALTDAADLTQWYVAQAEIDARPGGRYWISWGPGEDGTNRIEVFEPPNRLLLSLRPPEGEGAEGVGLERPITEEFCLDSQAGATVLRLVNSGIPATADWDAFYEGTRVGWGMYLLALRRFLEGPPAEVAPTPGPAPGDAEPSGGKPPRHYFEHLPERFDAAAAAGLTAVVQYEIGGAGGGSWVVSVLDGALEVHEGRHADPTLTLSMEAADYVDLASGRLTGRDALTQGKMRVRGKTQLLPRWGALFRR